MQEQHDYEAYIRHRVLAFRRIAYRLTGSWNSAEDLVQETFIKLYLHWGKAARAGSIDAYTRRILVNTYLAQARKSWFRRILPFADPPERPEQQSDHDGRLDLHAALARLPAGRRTVLVLRYWDGLDVAETAELLGCSTGNVKSQTSAAIATLRRLLPGYVSSSRSAGTDRSTA